MTAACRAAGIGRTTWYDWVNEDPEFARALAHAEEEAADSLEAAARQRALNGSDVMTIFLLKGLRPEKFRDGPRTIVQAAAGFDEHGQPTAGVQISEQGMSLVERFAAYQAEHRDAIEAEATG